MGAVLFLLFDDAGSDYETYGTSLVGETSGVLQFFFFQDRIINVKVMIAKVRVLRITTSPVLAQRNLGIEKQKNTKAKQLTTEKILKER